MAALWNARLFFCGMFRRVNTCCARHWPQKCTNAAIMIALRAGSHVYLLTIPVKRFSLIPTLSFMLGLVFSISRGRSIEPAARRVFFGRPFC
jgi:hypothetical protein